MFFFGNCKSPFNKSIQYPKRSVDLCHRHFPSVLTSPRTLLLSADHTNSPGGSAPGEVHITTPAGNTITGSFSNICTSTATKSGTCPAPDIKAQCPAEVVPSDAMMTCYTSDGSTNDAGIPQTQTVSNTCDAFPQSSGNYAINLSNFYAIVTGATSGTYKVRTTGTDFNLDPCPYGHPCSMSASKYCKHSRLTKCPKRYPGRLLTLRVLPANPLLGASLR